ncbi:MAG: DegT/DnrJ/EryC1/StrS family aminotransferase [Anaerolineae bacterium]|nr:DegT/DnrJ/EryC1/StrS family aminotransferase [Anaerolineae bacterium]
MSAEPVRVPFIDLTAQRLPFAQEIDEALARVMRSNSYILGEEVGLFEQEFAAYCEVAHAVGVDSGTSALELILRAYGIGPGDEVITAANTFVATTFAISYTGARPVLVDVDPYTYTLDIFQLQEAITPRTRAIIPVHLYGQPADMEPILALAQQHNLIVVEDACQAHGSRYKGRRVGSLGHAAAFSFYPAKNLGAFGDGGIVVTNDPDIADTVSKLRNYGQSAKYYHDLLGYNRRLDTLQAAILRIKLRHLDEWNAARRAHARLYQQLLGGNGIRLPVEANYAEAVWHLFVIRTVARDELQAYLKEQNIGTGIHYPVPIHLQGAHHDLGYGVGDFPVTEHSAGELLSLPMYAELTPAQIVYVADAIKTFLAEHIRLHAVG